MLKTNWSLTRWFKTRIMDGTAVILNKPPVHYVETEIVLNIEKEEEGSTIHIILQDPVTGNRIAHLSKIFINPNDTITVQGMKVLLDITMD